MDKGVYYRHIVKQPSPRRRGRKARRHMDEPHGAACIYSGTSSPIPSQTFCCMCGSMGRWAFCDVYDRCGGGGFERAKRFGRFALLLTLSDGNTTKHRRYGITPNVIQLWFLACRDSRPLLLSSKSASHVM